MTSNKSNTYFTAQEADLFTFYRIPKELITNPKYKHVCSDAKLLYGLLLDRNSLSIKNGWIDERGYVYIYFSREEAMEVLGIANPKATSLFKELRDVDLIEEVRQGLGKANIIFVKKFIHPLESVAIPQNQEKLDSGTKKNLTQEPRKTCPNNTDSNNIYLNENESQSVSQSPEKKEPDGQTDEVHTLFEQAQVELFENEALKEHIKEAITQAYTQPATRNIIQRIRLEHIDRALAKFREAQEQQNIKNPKLYFFKCLISAITEHGLSATAWTS